MNIKQKIERLLAMGQDSRTNKFEAEAALRQAESMMRKHAIDRATIRARTGQAPVYNWRTVIIPASNPPARNVITWIGMLGMAVSEFTDTLSVWVRHPEHGTCIQFQGDEPDTIMAAYLMKHLRDSTRAESARHPGSRSSRETFRRSMAARLQERVQALKAERAASLAEDAPGEGNALVAVNNKLTERDKQFKNHGYTTSAQRRKRDDHAAQAGRSAGDRVGLNTPVTHQHAALN